jgi:hypothetical protein
LGPERTTAVCWWGFFRWDGSMLLSYGVTVLALVVVGVWGCVLVENCTVDASIFVVKLLRANGGCLGTRSR